MSKGDDTRKAILECAVASASELGLEQLTIGGLAGRVGMSKSGIYAHFDSKEALQIAVLGEARDRFIAEVIAPALARPRGEARLRALFEGWLGWEEALPGGCIFLAAAAELDDRPGPARDFLVSTQRDWVDSLSVTARTAVEEAFFRADLDLRQWAFDALGIMFAYHHFARLLRSPEAEARARAAFEALLERSRPAPG